MRLSFHGASVGTVRERLVRELSHCSCSADHVDDARVVVSELVANSLRHAQPLDDGTIAVEWRLRSGHLRLTVTDGGSTSHPARRHRGELALDGRGLTIVQSLARRWGVESEEAETTVWAELDVR